MIKVLEQAKYDHRKIIYPPLKVSLEPLVCLGVVNLNNIHADMALSGRHGKNMIAADISDTSFSAGGENLLFVFSFSRVYKK